MNNYQSIEGIQNDVEPKSTVETSISCSGDYKMYNNIDANDVDEEIAKKLRGDTIGDTLFSQSFVLKTLLKFSALEWDEQVEDDLCFLWDMTVEKDVCTFLMDISYPSLACTAILQYEENNRFVEIVVGILANIMCSGCQNTMTKDQIGIILSLIHSDDHLILIQLMRFITRSSETTELLIPFIDEDFFSQMCFILKNSLNIDLLLRTLETVAKLTTDCVLSPQLVSYNMYESTMICYKTVTKNEDKYFEPDTKETLKCIKYMLECITNLCVYTERFEKSSLLTDLQTNSNIFANEIMKILSFFTHVENLIPVTDNFIYIMSAITYIFVNLKLKYIPELFLSVTRILEAILDIRNEVEELFESTLELECYLISSTQQENIHKDLKVLSRHKVKKILNVVNENCIRFGLSSCINQFLLNCRGLK